MTYYDTFNVGSSSSGSGSYYLNGTPPSSPKKNTSIQSSPKITPLSSPQKLLRPRQELFSPSKEPLDKELDTYVTKSNAAVRDLLASFDEVEVENHKPQTTSINLRLGSVDMLKLESSSTLVKTVKSSSYVFAPVGDVVGKGNFKEARLALSYKLKQEAEQQRTQTWAVFAEQNINSSTIYAYSLKENLIVNRIEKALQKYPFVKSITRTVDHLYLNEDNKPIPNKHVIVSEYCNGGNLSLHLSQISVASVDIIIPRLIDALCFLHQIKIFHSDIKAGNVLIELNDLGEIINARLADFGLSCDLENEKDRNYKGGDKSTLSPEFLKIVEHYQKEKIDLKIEDEVYKEDVYALALLLKRLLKNCPSHPFNKNESFTHLLEQMTLGKTKDRIDIFKAKDLFLEIRPKTKFYYDVESKI